MGICMVLRALSDENIERILADPPLVWRVVVPDDVNFYLKESGQSKAPGWWARIFGSKHAWPPRVLEFELSDAEAREVDLDKSWDGVHICANRIARGGDCPNLFEDGKSVGHVEVGCGAAACFTNAAVARLQEVYAAISEGELLAQYAPNEMKGVYPEDLWKRRGDDCREYLTENFSALKAYLGKIAKNRLGMLIQ